MTHPADSCSLPVMAYIDISMLQLNQGKWIDIIYKIIGMRIQIRRRSNVGFHSILN